MDGKNIVPSSLQGENILCAIPSGKMGYDKLSQNSKLVLVSEHILGDTLQFMRYAIALENRVHPFTTCTEKLAA